MPRKQLSPQEEVQRIEALKVIEKAYYQKGYYRIAGVDEAGRGPLAGPVYAAAVILPGDVQIPGIDDSKKLSEKKREALFDVICDKAVAYNIASVPETVIDEVNILNATFLAMNQAVKGLSVQPDFVLIDGNRIQGMALPHETVVKGDAKSISIAAASILAKVSRDRYIKEIAVRYPQYGLEKHKGYGTREHIAALRQYGPCPIHRKSFLKKILREAHE